MLHALFEDWFANRFVNRIVHKAMFAAMMVFCLGWSAWAALESDAPGQVSASARGLQDVPDMRGGRDGEKGGNAGNVQGQTMCTFERRMDVKNRIFPHTLT